MDAPNHPKEHRAQRAGSKIKKKKQNEKYNKDQGKNPRAFIFKSSAKAKKARTIAAEKQQRKLRAPIIDRQTQEPPPFVVLVQGPPRCGKTTVIRSLVKHYTRHALSEVKGPVTVVSGKRRRIQFLEVGNDLNDMVDAAKLADLVLLIIDGSYGFEMETFEFLNVLQVHGFPKVLGVLTHLDHFSDPRKLKKQKKTLKSRFWSEIYHGAKLFYLGGIHNGRYITRDTLNLARFISTSKFKPLTWRSTHPYVVGDRFENITQTGPNRDEANLECDVAVYGWLHGCNMRSGQLVHIAGVGDCAIDDIQALPDPCPLPACDKKQRKLAERSKLLYAPMSDVGGLLFDKDAVYLNVDDRKVNFTRRDEKAFGKFTEEMDDKGDFFESPGVEMVHGLHDAHVTLDKKLTSSRIRLLTGRGLLKEDDNTNVFGDKVRQHGTINAGEQGMNSNIHSNVAASRARRAVDFECAVLDRNRSKVVNRVKDIGCAGSGRDNTSGHAACGLESTTKFAGADRKRSIMNSVYGKDPPLGTKEKIRTTDHNALFTQARENTHTFIYDSFDASKSICTVHVLDYSNSGLRSRFVTGDWTIAAGRHEGRSACSTFENEPNAEKHDGHDEIYGNFEDLETGEMFCPFAGKHDILTNEKESREEEVNMEERRRDEKILKKNDFLSSPDAEIAKEKDRDRTNAGIDIDTKEPLSYFDLVKSEQQEQIEKTHRELDGLNDVTRKAVEGFRPGSYLRLVLRRVPREWVCHFNPARPLLIGGLLPSEDSFGYQHLRFKKHRWFGKSGPSHFLHWLAQIPINPYLFFARRKWATSHDQVHPTAHALPCNYLRPNYSTEHWCCGFSLTFWQASIIQNFGNSNSPRVRSLHKNYEKAKTNRYTD
jgi:ribosome biogenesis protein BMS1